MAICLPYLLASVLVDFVHVHRQPAASASAAAGEPSLTPASTPAPQPDYTCTACVWLRTGLQLAPNTADGLAVAEPTIAVVLAPDAMRPDALLARSALLRGPPSSLLA